MSQVPVPLRRVQKKLVFSRSTWGWGEGLMIPIWLREGGGAERGVEREDLRSPWCVPNPNLCLVLPPKLQRDTEVHRVAKCRSAQDALVSRDKGRREAHCVPQEAGKGCLSLAGNPKFFPGASGPPHSPPPSSKAPAPLQSDVSATACLELVPTPQGKRWREAAGMSQGPRPPPGGARVDAQGSESRSGLETCALATAAAGADASAQRQNQLAAACAPGHGALCRRPPEGSPPGQGALLPPVSPKEALGPISCPPSGRSAPSLLAAS